MAETEKSVRLQRREARVKAVHDAFVVKRVRVNPKDDTIRRVLRHPRAGGFRAKGSIEWPLDQFTRRRIQDGSVTIEERNSAARTQAQARPAHAPSSL